METQRKLELNPINARTQQTMPPPTRFPLSLSPCLPNSHKCPVAQIRLYQTSLPPSSSSHVYPSLLPSLIRPNPPPPPPHPFSSCRQHLPYLHMDCSHVSGAWKAVWWFGSCLHTNIFNPCTSLIGEVEVSCYICCCRGDIQVDVLQWSRSLNTFPPILSPSALLNFAASCFSLVFTLPTDVNQRT